MDDAVETVTNITMTTMFINVTISGNSDSTSTQNLSQVLLDRQNDIEQRLTELLRQHNLSAFQYFSKLAGIPTYTIPVTTTYRVPYTSGVVSWGFITPITLIGMFLIVVVLCLVYHNWRDKRLLRSYTPAIPVPDFTRESSTNSKHEDGSRGSIRSNHSSRSMGSSTFEKGQILPLPRKASLRLARVEEGWKIAGQPRVLSPIDEHESSNPKSAIIEIKPAMKRGLSSYHMTWIAETSRENESKNSLNGGSIHVVDNPISNQLGNDQLYEDAKIPQLEAKSPYHPHHNTPTNEYDEISECSENPHGGESVVSTHISLPSTIYPALGRAPTSGADLSSIHTYFSHQRPLSSRQDDFNNPSEEISTTTSFTESVSGTLSLPSSISRFHASRLYNTPNHPHPLASTHNGSHVKLNFTVSSSIDMSENNSQYSDNTSMFPNVGSSITSFGPSVGRSNPTSSCPSDVFSPDYIYGNVGRPSGTGPSTRQNSLSTNSGDGHIPPTADNSRASPAREAEMFRNWSLSAGINSGSLGNLPALAPTPLPSGESYSISQNKDDSTQSKSDGHITKTSYDLNHNISPIDTRKVKFSVPVLNKKQYWV